MKELIIDVQNEIENIYLVEDETLVEKYVNSKNKKRLEGNIYIGKVQNVVSALQAAFVNVGESKNAFIHFKDLLPKVDVVKNKGEEVSLSDVEKKYKTG